MSSSSIPWTRRPPAAMVQLAKQQNVPVVSYDRLVLDSPDVNAYVSFDNVKVGQLQGDTLATS